MAVRPRNRQPGGTGGIARLGNSNLNPVLSEFIDNGTPGFPADSFITVENRLSQPLNVSPSFAGAAADYSSYYTVPPLTRSTVPIDPQRGVLLSVSNELSILDRDGSSISQLRTFEKRTIAYRLHSDGAAPSEPLYPLNRCLFASQDYIVNQGAVSFAFVGGAWPGASNNRMALGIDGICIVAITMLVYNNSLTTGAGPLSILDVGCYYDPDNTTQKVALITAANFTPVGTRITMETGGCVAIGFGIGGTGAISISCGFYIGVPGA